LQSTSSALSRSTVRQIRSASSSSSQPEAQHAKAVANTPQSSPSPADDEMSQIHKILHLPSSSSCDIFSSSSSSSQDSVCLLSSLPALTPGSQFETHPPSLPLLLEGTASAAAAHGDDDDEFIPPTPPTQDPDAD